MVGSSGDSSGQSPLGRFPSAGNASTELDVSFGRQRSPKRRRSSARRRWIAGGAIVVLAAIVAVEVTGAQSNHSATARSPTALAPSAPATVATTSNPSLSSLPVNETDGTANETGSTATTTATFAAPTSAGARTDSTIPGQIAPIGPIGPIDAQATGLGLFVLDYREGTLLSRIDLVTGTATAMPIAVDLGPTRSAIGISGSGATAVPYSSGDAGGDAAAECSDGTLWVVAESSGALALRHVAVHPGSAAQVVTTVTLASTIEFVPSALVGTTADCRPTFTGPDGRGYVVDPTGTVTRLNDGLLVTVQHGFYAEVVCSANGSCGLVLYGAGGASVTLPSGGRYSQVVFDHTGTLALVVASGDRGPFAYVHGAVQLVDFATGTATTLLPPPPPPAAATVGTATVVTATPAPTPAITNPIRSATWGQWAQWTPDDSLAVVSTGDRLWRVDVGSKTATPLATATGFERGAESLAIT